MPPERLGGYLREFRALLGSYALDGLLYGHFGDGCVHVRIDFRGPPGWGRPAAPLPDRRRPPGHRVLRVMSGEHGDGRARSELLPVMYSAPAVLASVISSSVDPAICSIQGCWSGPGRWTPTSPARRRGAAPAGRLRVGTDSGDFTTAVHRCVGVGKCGAGLQRPVGSCARPTWPPGTRRTPPGAGPGCCRKWRPGVVTGGWRAPEVREALDLCLSCKACAPSARPGWTWPPTRPRCCTRPTGAGCGRAATTRSASCRAGPGWPRGAGPGLANAALRRGLGRGGARLAAGIEPRRSLPPFAAESFRSWYRRQGGGGGRAPAGTTARTGRGRWCCSWTPSPTSSPRRSGRPRCGCWTDAGFSVTIPARPTCCAITWISTGQLTAARRILGRTVCRAQPGHPGRHPDRGPGAVLHRHAALRRGGPVPRGAARGRGGRRHPDAGRAAHRPAAARPGPGLGAARPGRAGDHRPAALPPLLGAWATTPTGRCWPRRARPCAPLAGCCGLAGNFGMERGHYEVSVAVAETALLPALRAAPPGAVYLADGFSCRTQAAQLAGVRGDAPGRAAGQPAGTRTMIVRD